MTINFTCTLIPFIIKSNVEWDEEQMDLHVNTGYDGGLSFLPVVLYLILKILFYIYLMIKIFDTLIYAKMTL